MKQKQLRKWRLSLTKVSPKDNENIMFYNYGKPLFNISKIDRLAFTIGVAFFFLFNVFYWLTFMNFNFNII